jgi:hypothetical protein
MADPAEGWIANGETPPERFKRIEAHLFGSVVTITVTCDDDYAAIALYDTIAAGLDSDGLNLDIALDAEHG